MNFTRWIVGFLVAVTVTVFAVSNRHYIQLYVSPLHPPMEYPLYIIILGCLGFGFILGGSLVWLNSAPLRKTKRDQKRQIRDLEKALKAVNENSNAQTPPSDLFSALPHPIKSKVK